jgi:hypothetical protein
MVNWKGKDRAQEAPSDGPVEPDGKLEAEAVTGDVPEPGNVSDHTGQPVRAPKRAEKLNRGKGKGKLVAEPVENDATASEKIGAGPGIKPTAKPTTHYRYQHVILPAGPDTEVCPGPESAAIVACQNAGYRPVGVAKLEGMTDHPDGVSKIVTWSIPAVEASDPAWREGKAE